MMNKFANTSLSSVRYCFFYTKHKKDNQVVMIKKVKEPSGPIQD